MDSRKNAYVRARSCKYHQSGEKVSQSPMKFRLFFVVFLVTALLSGCTTFTGGEPEVVKLGEGKYYISAKTGPWLVEQPQKAAKKFSAKASELCSGRAYTESEVREWSMIYHDRYLVLDNSTITIRDGRVECR